MRRNFKISAKRKAKRIPGGFISTAQTGFSRIDFNLIFMILLFCFIPVNICGQVTGTYDFTTKPISRDFQKLIDFDGLNTGADPQQIVVVGDLIYGVCLTGGANDDGILFAVKTDGSNFQKIDFSEELTGSGPSTISITFSQFLGWIICGATIGGGDYGKGTLFRFDNNGFKTFQSLNFGSGNFGFDRYLYNIITVGLAIYGIGWSPWSGEGVVFFDNVFGLGMKTLANLSGWPRRGLVAYGDYVYGVTQGSFSENGSPGTLYKLKYENSEFETLHLFDSYENGLKPASNLVILDDTIFGGTSAGGIYNFGTVYKIGMDGGGFERLGDYPPDDQNDDDGCSINYMATSDSSIYGMDESGGLGNYGAIVRLNYATGLTKLFEFSDPQSGLYPGSFVISEDIIYGIARGGGAFGRGALYKYYLNGRPESQSGTAKSIKLAIAPPGQLLLKNKRILHLAPGTSLDLDTLFTVTGNIPFEHNWRAFSENGPVLTDPLVEITSEVKYYLNLITIQGCEYTDSTTIFIKGTGIPSIRSSNNISIFPNPGNGEFQLMLPPGNFHYRYIIADYTGRTVATGYLERATSDGIYLLRASQLKTGIYLLSVLRGEEFEGNTRLVIMER